MKTWKHITREQRKTISSCIAHNYKLVQIGKILNLDPTSISKEVKRNRTSLDIESNDYSECDKLKRWPYVCTNCNNRYKKCPFNKLIYDVSKAQRKADSKLINSRKGLDLDKEEFKLLDKTIKNGVDNNKSIYQIVIENKDKINKSINYKKN